ncbi:hypothetical protein FHS42_006061 [Streptomyces zagrosensis]|uniref:Uncharacterized protein n=1 Tax=Streptomyces zagrosensis TaxID=1042984 RepID=A0A7W9V2L0_9ACTN|nr:hypothetical protein [Streptomyces zagrosensis]MBB5938969.1 hypothetical protein [Streptomyces zagrosensis]
MDSEIRKNRKPGAGKLTSERAAYFQLMEQGYSTRVAARIVGIDLRTGKKWRNGHHAPGKGLKVVSSDLPGARADARATGAGGTASAVAVSPPHTQLNWNSAAGLGSREPCPPALR